jgi:RNA binding exosome subunit
VPGVPFHYADLRAFSYATEDVARVERALRTFLPGECEIDRTESEGYHGDPIRVLSARVENADDVRHVLARVSAASAFPRIFEELDERVDENCSLFLRFDKQAAYEGEVRLGEGIDVRLKVEAYPAKREAAVENAREALSEYVDD